MMFAALAATAGTSSAAITVPTTIDFEALPGASVDGKPNLSGAAGNSGTYLEDGVRVGVVNDPLSTSSHVHREPATPDHTVLLAYHSDSSGIYIRPSDDTAFGLSSLDFHSAYDAAENPHVVGLGDGTASDYWDIYGFSDARNPGLLTANGTFVPDDPTHPEDGGVTWNPTDPNTGNPAHPAVAHATIVNGTDQLGLNVLSLDPNFANIKSFWIHYNGYPHNPNTYVNPDGSNSAYQFAMEVDNINLIPAPAAVPVPAAVWMFLSGMMGLLAIGKKRANLAA